jgi:hypothetical protein
MGEMSEINLSAFGSRLSSSAIAVFRSLFENALNIIIEEGPRKSYEKQLAELMGECGLAEMEAVADSIREIIQRRIEYKKGEYQLFFAFFASIYIENGIIKYSLPREIEDVMMQARIQDLG